MPTHVVLLRGVNNLGGKQVAMAELREVVASLGHADVMTYIQSGNVLFRLLHAVFLPEVPGPGLAAWVADAERQVQANGSQDEARLLGRAVYLHTPDGYPRSELRRRLARAGGPTSAVIAGTARNWATVCRLVELCRNHGETRAAAR
jgi:uncharacterized protein (DUF1697 family)